MKKTRLAIIGCGQICDQYGEHITLYPDELEIAGAMDLDASRATGFCGKYGGRVYPNLEAILEDPSVHTVVNLAVHHQHYDLNLRALKAGKHVYSEKPMALTYGEAQELTRVACEAGCRLAAAPSTFLGEGVQTAARMLEADLIGPLRLVYAEANWGQINRWIGSPRAYFSVGPLLDVGVYAITSLVYLLGPVRSVWGYSTILQKDRVGPDQQPFPVNAPDLTVGMMEFANGVTARLTTNYYVPPREMPHLRGFEFHGDDGSLSLSDFHFFDARCQWHPYQEPGLDIPLLREPSGRMDRAVGLVELHRAIADGRPHRTSAEQATHVIEVMEGLQRSWETSTRVAIHSRFEKSPMMKWARQAPLQLPPHPTRPA